MRAVLPSSVLVFGVLAAAAAAAQEVPRFDVDRICRNKPDAAECLGLEQQAYTELKGLWPQVSDYWKAECTREAAGQKAYQYFYLRDCTKAQVEEDKKAADLPHFKY